MFSYSPRVSLRPLTRPSRLMASLGALEVAFNLLIMLILIVIGFNTSYCDWFQFRCLADFQINPETPYVTQDSVAVSGR